MILADAGIETVLTGVSLVFAAPAVVTAASVIEGPRQPVPPHVSPSGGGT
ncbi:hypothetical protein ACWC9T_25675 [Kitasatospora sp. NPDC001159]